MEFDMKRTLATVCGAAILAAGTLGFASAPQAAPWTPGPAKVMKVEMNGVDARRSSRHFRHNGDRAYWGNYRGYRHHRHGYRQYRGFWFPPAAFATGAIVGGIIANSGPSYSGGLPSAHYRWCDDRYRSYRAWDNTFQPYNGPRRQCYSPYS